MEGIDSDIDRSLPNRFAEVVTLLTGICEVTGSILTEDFRIFSSSLLANTYIDLI